MAHLRHMWRSELKMRLSWHVVLGPRFLMNAARMPQTRIEMVGEVSLLVSSLYPLWCEYTNHKGSLLKGPFMQDRNCVKVPICWLLSAASQRVSNYNEFNLHATPNGSNIAISVQDGAVHQCQAVASLYEQTLALGSAEFGTCMSMKFVKDVFHKA